ncbi:N-acetylmuramoyl-L-alanine amidase (plasmid) [Streptomyces sp. BI20]|uniref:N-acetylmuramoyl-L-alanine amidase n=1 Tax=Streptomyces sp. BI20 TaxID=3403460 RepID=UPI003C79110F
MATPKSADQFLAALIAEGVKVVERPGWRTHNRNHVGAWGPVNGVMVHHTVTKGTQHTVDLCSTGYEGLPGPLCHGVIGKDGVVYLIGYGRANHAGAGDSSVLNAVIAEKATFPKPTKADVDGNPRFIGWECENMGDGSDPWPAAQLEAIERASAAVCRSYGWTAQSVIGHLEWQPGKVDPKGFSMNDMRKRIATRLASPPNKGDGGNNGGGGGGANTYTVKAGDTLSSIARQLGVPWQELALVNDLVEPYTLTPGQVLKVPR